MREYESGDIRNVAVVGHGSSGKTSLVDALVFAAGGSRRHGSVRDGTALTDSSAEEAERGFTIASIAGTSSGALVGGIHAAGRLREFDAAIQAMSRRDFLRLLDPAIGRGGMLRGNRLVDAMREVVGDPLIEDLRVPFTAVAVDLLRHRQVWLTRGPLWDALRASFAIPGVFLPHVVHDRELVDGAMLAPLPIAATRQSEAHRLVAVDMHALPARPPADPPPAGATDVPAGPGGEPSRGRWRRSAGAGMGLVELMSRSLDTMQGQMARIQLAMDPPELVIPIPREVCHFYEFWRAKELIAIGREAAALALDDAGY